MSHYRVVDRLSAVALERRERIELHSLIALKKRGHLLELSGVFTLVELVRLGHHDDERNTAVIEKVHHVHIVGRGLVAHVDDLHHQCDIAPGGKVALYQLRPSQLFDLADLGVAVAGQIDEVERTAVKEVDRGGLAGLGADAREGFSVTKLINQRGLADVGASRKDDIRAVVGPKL